MEEKTDHICFQLKILEITEEDITVGRNLR